MIEPLDTRDVKAVAELHCATLTGLLTQMGPRAVEAFYMGCVKSTLAIGLVYLEQSNIRGFVLGSPHPDRLKRDIFRQNPIGLLSALLAKPSSIVPLLESLGGPEEGHCDRRAPDLSYLSVAREVRGGGIGTKLVEAFSERMRIAEVDGYNLSVDEDNGAAIAFYEHLGFHVTGRYREFGIRRLRYRLFIA